MSEVSRASHPAHMNTQGAARRRVLVKGNFPVIAGRSIFMRGEYSGGPWDDWGKSSNKLIQTALCTQDTYCFLWKFLPQTKPLVSHTLQEGIQTLDVA